MNKPNKSRRMTTGDDPYENLANAIILQAVSDYRSTQRGLRKHPKSSIHLSEAGRIEAFFESEWFTTLTSVDGRMLMRKLREEGSH